MHPRDVVDAITLPHGWVLRLDEFTLPTSPPRGSGRYFIQVRDPNGICNTTGKPAPWGGRKWSLSEHMTETEIVNTAWLALKQAMEHELAEQFHYKGVAVNNPHVSVANKLALAGHEEDRRAA